MSRYIPKLALLFLIEAGVFLGGCMAESDLASFTVRLMHTSEVKALPDEMAYSYPVPLKNHHVAVFVYRMATLPPGEPKISTPKKYIEAVYPGAQIVQFRNIIPSEFGIPAPPDGTLGTVVIPPEYMQPTVEEYYRRKTRFDEIYSQSLSAYLSGSGLDAVTANQVLTQLPVFGVKPLLPILKAANPDFFVWLEKNAKH